MIRNITFADSGTSVPPAAETHAEPTLRLRKVTVSPAEEYHLRPGEVRPISNELAAAILSRKGRAEVTLKGIVIDRKDMGGRNRYWHPDSRVCNDLSARERKLFYVVNIHQPDVCHLLDDQGCYIESLPAIERPEVLNTEQQARVAASHHRQIGRVAAHLQSLHGEETREALDTLAANSAEMQRVVQTLPATGRDFANPVQPMRSTHGEAADLAAADIRRGTYDRTTPASRERAESTADVLTRRAKTTECPF